MTDSNLTVRVNADTEDAVESINEVTEAVEELEAALERLESTPVTVHVDSVSALDSANTSGLSY